MPRRSAGGEGISALLPFPASSEFRRCRQPLFSNPPPSNRRHRRKTPSSSFSFLPIPSDPPLPRRERRSDESHFFPRCIMQPSFLEFRGDIIQLISSLFYCRSFRDRSKRGRLTPQYCIVVGTLRKKSSWQDQRRPLPWQRSATEKSIPKTAANTSGLFLLPFLVVPGLSGATFALSVEPVWMTLLQSFPSPTHPFPLASPGKGCCPKLPPPFPRTQGKKSARGEELAREGSQWTRRDEGGSLHLNQSGEFSPPFFHTTVVVWTGQTSSSSLPHFKSSSLFLFLLSRPSAFHHRGMEEEHFFGRNLPFSFCIRRIRSALSIDSQKDKQFKPFKARM